MSRTLPASVRARLRYVRSDQGTVDLRRFPDFLIVGPQRTGTTWLHANLREHPEVMLSEPKEIYYFSRLKAPGDAKFQSAQLSWYLKFFREPAWLYVYKQYVCLRAHRELYRPRVRGEATASYAALDEDVIAEIVLLRPDIKVVMMVRDPVERAWSHAKKDLVRNRKREMTDVSDDEFERFFRDPYQLRCAQYVDNYDRWARHLRPGHLMLGRFDDISRRPEALLREFMVFLGVSADQRYIGRLARQSVNPTGASRIPERHRVFLENLFESDERKLRERFNLGWR